MFKENIFPLFVGVLLPLSIMVACGGTAASTQVNEPTQDLKIEVQVDGLEKGVCKLLGVFTDQNFMVDSTMSDASGKMSFAIDSLIPPGLYYVLFPNNDYIQLLLDKDQHVSFKTSAANLVDDMKVSGSLDNELFYKNLKYEADYDAKVKAVQAKMDAEKEGTAAYDKYKAERDALIDKRLEHIEWFSKKHPDSFFTTFKLAGQNPHLTYPKKPDGTLDTVMQVYQYRNHFWDGVDFGDERLLRTPVIYNKMKRYMGELTDQKTDSLIKYADIVVEKSKAGKEMFKYVVNFIALKYQKPTIMGLEAVYVHMVDKYFTPELAFWSDEHEINGLRREADEMKPSLLGQVGQDVRAKDVNGVYKSLYDLKSQVLLVFIYSSTCEHCQKEAPELAKLYREWHPKGVDFYGICVDADLDAWKDFVKKYGLQFTNVIDPNYESQYYKKYHIDITPEMYVLDKDRIIVGKNLKANQLPQIFEKNLATGH